MTISSDPSVGGLVSMTERSVTEDPELGSVLRWMRRELTVPHSEMGRSTAVCPFMSRALATNAIWMAKVPSVNHSSHVAAAVMDSVSRFEDLPSIAEEHLKAMVLVFPSVVTADDAVGMIDEVQYALKPALVDAGFMIGELHPWNATPPQANPGSPFRPNRSPSSAASTSARVMRGT